MVLEIYYKTLVKLINLYFHNMQHKTYVKMTIKSNPDLRPQGLLRAMDRWYHERFKATMNPSKFTKLEILSLLSLIPAEEDIQEELESQINLGKLIGDSRVHFSKIYDDIYDLYRMQRPEEIDDSEKSKWTAFDKDLDELKDGLARFMLYTRSSIVRSENPADPGNIDMAFMETFGNFRNYARFEQNAREIYLKIPTMPEIPEKAMKIIRESRQYHLFFYREMLGDLLPYYCSTDIKKT